MRNGKAAGQWALNRVKSESYPGYCKKFVRSAFDLESKSGSAAEALRETKYHHKPMDINDTPAFVPAYFDTGRFGHVVITVGKDSHGRRLCVSTDVQDSDHDGRREVGIVPLEKLKSWGPFQGWGEDLDGVRIYNKSTASGLKSVHELALEVILGKWGDGAQRKARLQKAGYSFSAVQHEVNILTKR